MTDFLKKLWRLINTHKWLKDLLRADCLYCLIVGSYNLFCLFVPQLLHSVSLYVFGGYFLLLNLCLLGRTIFLKAAAHHY
ncbi:hypothetical protein [Limosilactobacillus mucosae]|uniref:hypothetical protein n=1 Tax=Limosilactobacillus mucosae TaxID=97478 RepID=UPI00088166B9|nr:hypothetical protein [Limosilactobacillus mucosae]QLI93827.1 hypothetical protein H0G69_01835 [Limosilactobacillus mucosae]SDN78284.1 hypothetical protein SAMN05216430_11622 [Limosilactobacillus mucosae]SEL30000.1 hypothetical protein SAMN05216545_11522 [Limosilactobacillus mucosae]SFK37543.1 hypothetical protein SAMN05216461_11622 [Limosilactobacillus mucosae]